MWARLNWLPLVIAGLVVLCLLALLLFRRRAKREGDIEAKPAKEAAKPGAAAATDATKEGAQKQTSLAAEPGAAPSVGVAPIHTVSESPTKSPSNSSPVPEEKREGEDKEREVFEL